MTPEDLAAVARTIELIAENPPQSEHWFVPGRGEERLERQVRDWLKEQL